MITNELVVTLEGKNANNYLVSIKSLLKISINYNEISITYFTNKIILKKIVVSY